MRLIDADVLLRPIPGYDPVKYTYEYGDVVTVDDNWYCKDGESKY